MFNSGKIPPACFIDFSFTKKEGYPSSLVFIQIA